jgi:hypothetical protein
MLELVEERYARQLIEEIGRITKNPEDLLIGRLIQDARVEHSDCCQISAVILGFEDGSVARITRYGIEFEEKQ